MAAGTLKISGEITGLQGGVFKIDVPLITITSAVSTQDSTAVLAVGNNLFTKPVAGVACGFLFIPNPLNTISLKLGGVAGHNMHGARPFLVWLQTIEPQVNVYNAGVSSILDNLYMWLGI